MRFSTVVALSAAAIASSAIAYPTSAGSSHELVNRDAIDESLYGRGTTKKTSKSAQAATNAAKLKKNLPHEIKGEIGKHGLDGSKAAADRAKALGTSQKDIQKAYKSKANQEIKSGNIPGASWGLQATLDENRRLRRDIEEIADLLTRSLDEDEGMFARGFDDDDMLFTRAKKTSKSAQAATNAAHLKKNLPHEIKAEIGKQGLDGSKAAADRAKTLGTSHKDIQKGYQPKLNQEIKSGKAPGASWGLQATLDNNRRLRRDLDVEEIVDLLTRSLEDDDELFMRDFDDDELLTRGFDEDDELFARAKKTSKSAQAATNAAHLKKNLPHEIKAEIGKQGLDGSKAAADRAKTLGTSQKDIQKGYQHKLNQEIKSGKVPGASWGLQATLDENRNLRRDVEEIVDLLTRSFEEDDGFSARGFDGDGEELFARAKKTSKSAQAATNAAHLKKNLPNEIKAEIGKQGLDGSKAAADRAKTLGTSQKDVQKAYKSKLNQEIKGGRIPGASWGLQATLDHNRQL